MRVDSPRVTPREPALSSGLKAAASTEKAIPAQARAVGYSGESTFTPANAARSSATAAVSGLGFGFPNPADIIKDIKNLIGKLGEVARTARGEPVNAHQKAELNKVFGDSLNTDDLSIVKGPAELFDRLPRYTPAFTVGNKIIVNPKNFPPPDDLLVHEAAHSWQYQNGGADYLPKALAAQYFGEGYDWQRGVKEGRDFAHLNPEQQAELIQDAYRHGYFDHPEKGFSEGGKDYSDFLRGAMDQVRDGKGTPAGWDLVKVPGFLRGAVRKLLEGLGNIIPG
jgi:hypothetical protein